MLLNYTLLMPLLGLCAYTDLKYHKIKNKYIMPFVLLGIMLQVYQAGFKGLANGLWALFIPLLILFPLFLLRMLPAGDIKLFGAIGAITGLPFVAHTFIYGFFIAAFYGVLLLIRQGIFLERMTYFYRYILKLILTGRYQPYHESTQKNNHNETNYNKTNDNKMTTTYQYPLAGFIALGAILHALLLSEGLILF